MTEEQLRNTLNQELAKFAGQLFKYVDRRFDEVSRDVAGVRQEVAKVYDRLDELEAKIDTKADADTVYKALDGIARRLDIESGERLPSSADSTAAGADITKQPRERTDAR